MSDTTTEQQVVTAPADEVPEAPEALEPTEGQEVPEDAIPITIDGDKQPRFNNREEQAQALAGREEITERIRPQLLSMGYVEEYLDEVLETLFTGRTLDEPPKIPTDGRLYGRMASEIDPDEKGDLHSAYDGHMEENWGF